MNKTILFIVKRLPAENLTPEDFREHPVWTFNNNDQRGETEVSPVKKLPVKNLDSCLIGTQVVLANGQAVDVLIGNVESHHARKTKHFLGLTVFKDGKKFHLARYQDPDYSRNGPDALAQFLSLPVTEVFPISYDLTALSKGIPAALKGTIEQFPSEVLTQEEILDLIFE